jgi:acetyltransferase-like isoleucine patch superfamily enzyme
MEKLKRMAAAMVSVLPFNALRICFYRLLFGYQIAGSAKIGFGTIIRVDIARIGSATIGRFNVFIGPFSLEIGDGASIGSGNRISCGFWALADKFRDSNYPRACRIGCAALITEDHYMDATGGFELGDRSWIAGRGSQFWTHGAKSGPMDRSIRIGQDSYIGSATRFTPGSGVADRSIVGIGSVVTKRFSQDRVMIAGVPARVVRENYYFRDESADASETPHGG